MARTMIMVGIDSRIHLIRHIRAVGIASARVQGTSSVSMGGGIGTGSGSVSSQTRGAMSVARAESSSGAGGAVRVNAGIRFVGKV